MFSSPLIPPKETGRRAPMLLLVSARGGDKPALPGFEPRRRGGFFCRAVKLLARAGDLCLIAKCPIAERRDWFQQIAPERGQSIVDAWRNYRKHRARDQSVALEPAQGQGQHALRDATDRTPQFIEPQGTAAELGDHKHRPFVADTSQHIADRAAVGRQMLVSRFHSYVFLPDRPRVTY